MSSGKGSSLLKGLLYLIILFVIFFIGVIVVWMLIPAILIGVGLIQPGPGFQDTTNLFLLGYVIAYWVLVILYIIYKRRKS